jgi:hypothetical protein
MMVAVNGGECHKQALESLWRSAIFWRTRWKQDLETEAKCGFYTRTRNQVCF